MSEEIEKEELSKEEAEEGSEEAESLESEEETEEVEDMDEPEDTEEEEPGIFDELYDNIFGSSWEMWLGSIILAVMSILLFMIASPWGSSGGLVNWGDNLFGALGTDFGKDDFMQNRYALLSVLMLMGALGSALLGKEFAIRVSPAGELVKGLLGGILMGIGCVLGMGCTVGNFFSGWAAMSAGALIFVLGLIIGVFAAVKYLIWEMMNHPGMSSGKSWTFLQAKTEGTSLQPLAGIIIVIIGAALALFFDSITEKVLIGFILIGLLIGIVLQRSRWCIVRALREPFMTGDADPALAIIAGLVVGLFGFTVFKIMTPGTEMISVAGNFWAPAIVGGIIFGFGMTIAGGCTVGSTWRAGEGHVKLWLSLVGIVIAGSLTQAYLKTEFLNMLPDEVKQQVFLPNNFGYFGSVVIMLLILLLWYVFVKWNERTGRFSAF